MSELDRKFDPKAKTALDYLRELVEDRDELKAEIAQIKEDLNTLKLDLQERNTLSKERDKRKNGFIAIAGLLGGFVMWLIQVVYESSK